MKCADVLINVGAQKVREAKCVNLLNFPVKVTPITFWLKFINLPKCSKFCSTCKLEVADKKFGLLTKKYLMNWQIRGLKDSISGNIWVVYSSLWTQILFVAIGTHMSSCYQLAVNNLLMTIKWIWDLNLFLSSLKASTSNSHVFFVASLVSNLRFKNFQITDFFLIQQNVPPTPKDVKYELIWYTYRPFFRKQIKIVNEVN